jgi:hypothetical protein
MVWIESFLPIGCRTFIWWNIRNIRQNVAPFLFGLRVLGIFQILYSRAVLQRTVVDFPAFLETGVAKRLRFAHIEPVCCRSRRIRGTVLLFLYEVAQNFELKHLKSNIKKSETYRIVVDVPFKAYPMVPDLIWPDGTVPLNWKFWRALT